MTSPELIALLQVIAVDLVLAGDNAIVVGMAAAGLAATERRKVIVIGIAVATLMRIFFALITTQLLQIIGLLFAGGLLLLWVSWKLWRELERQRITLKHQQHAAAATSDQPAELEAAPQKTTRAAIIQIVIADITMSLDNVLAVAGISREHTWILVVGLVLSVAFMGMAASWIARLLDKHAWIGYIGLLIILYVALIMMYEGSMDLVTALNT